MFAISLENEISVARTEFETYLIISAVLLFVLDHGDAVERRVDLALSIDRALVDAPEHDPVGPHEVVDGHALGQELRVHADPEVALRPAFPEAASSSGSDHVVGRARHDRALDDDDVVGRPCRDRLPDLAGGSPHEGQVDRVTVERRAHGDEGDVGVQDGLAHVGGRAQPRPDDLREELFEPVLVDRRLAGVDAVDLPLIDVDANAVVPDAGEARPGDQADVPRADDRDLHASSASGFPRYQSSVLRTPSSSPTFGS